MKAPSPRQSTKAILVFCVMAAWLCAAPISVPHALAVTRTEVQMGDPDIGDLAPKKAATVRIYEKRYPAVNKLSLLFEMVRVLLMRAYRF